MEQVLESRLAINKRLLGYLVLANLDGSTYAITLPDLMIKSHEILAQ